MLTLTLASALMLGAPALKAGKPERKAADPPDGEWMLERIESDGDVTDDSRKKDDSKRRLICSPTQWKLFHPTGRGAIASERAAWFDIDGQLEADFGTADNPKAVRKAIWKVANDTLTICRGSPGGPRPTDYSAPEGSHCEVWVFRRKSK